MSIAVIDASIAIKWFIDEDGTDAAIALHGLDLAAPEIFLPECTNVIATKHRLGEINDLEATIIQESILSASVVIYTGADLAISALKLSLALRHPAYDCYYMALAQCLACPFITSDARLLRKLAQTPSRDLFGEVWDLQTAAAVLR